MSPDGAMLATASLNGCIRFYEVDTDTFAAAKYSLLFCFYAYQTQTFKLPLVSYSTYGSVKDMSKTSYTNQLVLVSRNSSRWYIKISELMSDDDDETLILAS